MSGAHTPLVQPLRETVPDPLTRRESGPVARAVSRAIATFRDEAGDAIGPDEVRDVLAQLADRIMMVSFGKPGPRDRRLATVLARRLLQHLRASLVVDDDVDATELLPLLRAVEVIAQTIDPDWSEHFSARLAGPDALDLVVEVAHDLRSPLTSILFLAETLGREQSGVVNDLQRRQLGLIYGAALGLSNVASDIVEMARGGDRLLDEEPTPFSTLEILEAVRDIIQPLAEEKGLEIVLSPPASDHRLGHPLALSRVLLNLTTNALKFTDEGRVELRAEAHGIRGVEFSVRDTGRGIAPEVIDTLYRPFRRTAARKGDYCFSGTGLGLSICAKLVQAMDSELEIETRANWGTRFHFTLDLPPADTL